MPGNTQQRSPEYRVQRHPGEFKIERQPHVSVARRRVQGPPLNGEDESASDHRNHPEGFVCAWCGEFHPWRLMDGFDGHLKFCKGCIHLMDALELGLVEGVR